MLLLEDEPTGPRNCKRHENLQQIILSRAFSPAMDELVQPLGKQWKHSQHGAALNDYIEQISLVRQPSPLLGNQKMASRRDRQEFGDSFNDSKQNYGDP